jgi:biotin operon repressor
MNKEEFLCAYLKKHHKGNGRAIHASELEQLLSISERSIRRYINKLRHKGQPICSDSTGYYFAEEEKEKLHTTARLGKYERSFASTRENLQKAVIDAPSKNASVIVIVIQL